MKKIVVACDSFKGCLSSSEIALTVAEAIHAMHAGIAVETVPVADGGEGTVEALVAACDRPVTWITCPVDAPLPELPQVEARYAIDGNTAYMELAEASGLTLVPAEQRDVMRAGTLGTGQMILDAVERGCTHIVMGLGGSATCDGGMGVMAALGVEFLDSLGHELFPCAESVGKVFEIDCHGLRDDVLHTRITLVTDVTNPLCGPLGAARVFTPQKGATPQQVEALEQGMLRYARIIGDSAQQPGAGAAGGVAAGMTAFLFNCRIVAGAPFVLGQVKLASRIAGTDLVITGEGRIDGQTTLGKTPQAVAAIARQQGVPVVALCGAVDAGVDAAALGFERIIAVTPPHQPLAEAMQPQVACDNIRRAIAQIFSTL
ncbi:MAG: glycerate kinase [Muribaculaceae bacterium]|nr:glycerate kinase [Muribaculaceae bacterium]